MKKTILSNLALILAFSAPAPAAILVVSPDEYPTIQAAIDDANDGDTVMVTPRTYTGHGNCDIDFLGKAITVRSVAPENPHIVAKTVIDCNGTEAEPSRGTEAELHRGFYFHSQEGPNSVLEGLTITNGYADRGGAIYCHGSSPTIARCNITRNSANNTGGGVFCSSESSPAITNCTISGNTAYGAGWWWWWYDGGGGVFGCTGPITNCTIIGNKAKYNGGGLSRCSRVLNCIITGNSAGQGGGGTYRCDHIINCVVTGNSAGGHGGGLYNHDTYAIVTNCIFWANTDSTGTGESAQISGDTPDMTFSCIQDDDPNDSYIPFGGEDNGNIDDNPMFVRTADDGGDGWGDDPCTPDVNEGANDDFGDLHLTIASPCINTGDPRYPADSTKVDIDYQPRVMGGRIDVGADEYSPIILVTKPEGGEVWVSGSRHEIKWEGYGVAGTVDILLSTNNGSDWTEIEDNIANTGSYLWHLPDAVDSNQCTMSVVPSHPDADVIWIKSGLFMIHPDTPGPVVPSAWKSLGGDFDRAGLSENRGPELGCVKWQFQTKGPVSASPAIGAHDRVHIACEDGKLYTLDANGVLLWCYDANSPLISSPTVGPDGTVYVGSENGRLYAIDIDGNLRWNHTADRFIYSSPAVSAEGNNIYVCSADGVLCALTRDGSELWSFETPASGPTGASIFASPAIGPDGTVYVGAFYDPNLYALHPTDGSVKWVCSFVHLMRPTHPTNKEETFGWPFASPVVAPDGTIYQTLVFEPNLYAIEPNAGTIMWSAGLARQKFPWFPWFEPSLDSWFGSDCVNRRADRDGWSEPVLGPDGTIYVSLNDPYLRAVNPDGTIKWVARLGMTDGYTLTVGSDGHIYAAGNDGYLCVVDLNGNEIAVFNSNNFLKFPIISGDSTIIVSDANIVWAIGADGCEDQLSALHKPEDLDGSLLVNFIDVALLAADWLASTDKYQYPKFSYYSDGRCYDYYYEGVYFTGDINRDQYVDFADLAAVLNRWLNED
jgi:outer membrane protein assembly factor BamB